MMHRIWRAVYEGIAPRAGYPGEAFRLGFGPYALAQLVNGWLPILIFLIRAPAHLRVYGLLFVVFKVTIGTLSSAGIVCGCFPVLLHEGGVRARTLFGVAYHLNWGEIHAAAPIQWLFFTRYIRLANSKTRLAIWIPLFLTRQAEFNAKVREWAPPDNPLREMLETETSK